MCHGGWFNLHCSSFFQTCKFKEWSSDPRNYWRVDPNWWECTIGAPFHIHVSKLIIFSIFMIIKYWNANIIHHNGGTNLYFIEQISWTWQYWIFMIRKWNYKDTSGMSQNVFQWEVCVVHVHCGLCFILHKFKS